MAIDQARSLLDAVAADYEVLPQVTFGTMFRSPGLQVRGKIFAFLGHDDRLIVKLPRDRADEEVAAGSATPVVMGRRRMKEWIGYPVGADTAASIALWRQAAHEAFEYVQSLGGEELS